MKKNFKGYIVAWAVLFVLFNVIAFVLPPFFGKEKYTASFWIGYVLITVMLLGQPICAYMAFKAESAKKLFYNMSLIRISYTALIVSVIVGGLCMILPFVPYWIGAIVCMVILAISVFAVVGAKGAIEEIERIDTKIQAQTFFIKSLTIDANTLMASAKSDVVKAECRKVYEEIRYSDPLSHPALNAAEGQISIKFAEFTSAVQADDAEKARVLAGEILILVGDRNKKCKLLK